jgi:hypothetical protein
MQLIEEWADGHWYTTFRDDRQLFVGSRYSRIRLLAVAAAEDSNRVWNGHEGRAYSVAWPQHSHHFASVGGDGALKIWRGPDAGVIRRVASGFAGDFSISSQTGDVLIVNSAGAVQKVALDGSSEIDFGPGGDATRSAISADGSKLAVARVGGVSLFDGQTLQMNWQQKFPASDSFPQLAFAPRGDLLAVAVDAATPSIRLVDSNSGKTCATLPTECIRCRPAFSADAALLATKYQNDVLVWDVARREKKFDLRGHTSTINALAFSPQGHLLASVSNDRSLRLWDAMTGEDKGCIREHLDDIQDVTFSPDGRLLATCDVQGVIKLWSVSTKQPICDVTRFEESSVVQLRFSPDGRRLLWRTDARVLKVCDVGPPAAGIAAF